MSLNPHRKSLSFPLKTRIKSLITKLLKKRWNRKGSIYTFMTLIMIRIQHDSALVIGKKCWESKFCKLTVLILRCLTLWIPSQSILSSHTFKRTRLKSQENRMLMSILKRQTQATQHLLTVVKRMIHRLQVLIANQVQLKQSGHQTI